MSTRPPLSADDLDTIRDMFGTGFEAAVGLVVDRYEDGVLYAHLDAGPQHHQPMGLVHGGVYASIVEAVGSVAGTLAAQPNFVVGVTNSTDFIRSHRTGRLDVAARPVHLGRAQHLWQVDITRASDDKLVARGQLRLHVVTEIQPPQETPDAP